jgi:hypothetical protein
MTKKEFLEYCSYHKYVSRLKENNVNALFFEWKSDDEGTGYKYCVYARACNATKQDLINTLYDYYRGRILDTDWWIQLVVAPENRYRFKVPLSGSGLTKLIKYDTYLKSK